MEMYDLSQMLWARNKCFLFPYYPKDTLLKNQYTELVWQFKNSETDALQIVTRLAVQAFALHERALRGRSPVWYLVTMPPHTKGASNVPCEILCARLALHYSWLVHLPKALVRVEDVTKSATAKYEGKRRADYWDHVETISYEGPELMSPESGMILVDDVYTTGNTFDACYGIIRDVACCLEIIGFFVGTTVR